MVYGQERQRSTYVIVKMCVYIPIIIITLIMIITLVTPLLLFQVISEQWDGVLGRCDITVTSDPVTLGDLSVQVVSGLGMSVMANPTHPSIITATVTAYNILYNHHQVREALRF